MTKRRLSASVDRELLSAVESAVKRGSASNVSAWVTSALRRQLEHEQRLRAMGAFLAEYSRERGPITAKDLEASERWARQRTIRVGPGLKKAHRPRRRRA